jgi:hypothetical protein
MKIAALVTSIGFVVLSACSSSTVGAGASATDAGTNPSNPTGKTCTSDAECGAGYACEASSSSTCTPDRACSKLECRGICFARGEVDFMTGEPTSECLDDCAANAKCCDDSSTSGTCVRKSSPTPETDAAPIAIEWKGTWNATVEYDVSCDWGGNVKKGHNKHTLTIRIDGSNSALTGYPTTPTSGWNEMTGTGSSSGATLSGAFPFRDDTGEFVGSSENAVTLRANDVKSANAASGSIEGSGKGRFGAKCTISSGTLELAR